MSNRKSFFLAAGATSTCCTDVRHLLQQQCASHSIAAAAAVGHMSPGSASPYASLVGLTLAPFVRVHTHTYCSTYPVHVFQYVPCFPPRKSAQYFRDETCTTQHAQQAKELLVAGATTTTDCCTTSTADILLLLRPVISRRVGLTISPAACLGDMARTWLWTDRHSLPVSTRSWILLPGIYYGT